MKKQKKRRSKTFSLNKPQQGSRCCFEDETHLGKSCRRPFHPMGRLPGQQQSLKSKATKRIQKAKHVGTITCLLLLVLHWIYMIVDVDFTECCRWRTGMRSLMQARYRLCRCISWQCSWHFGDSTHPWPQKNKSCAAKCIYMIWMEESVASSALLKHVWSQLHDSWCSRLLDTKGCYVISGTKGQNSESNSVRRRWSSFSRKFPRLGRCS